MDYRPGGWFQKQTLGHQLMEVVPHLSDRPKVLN